MRIEADEVTFAIGGHEIVHSASLVCLPGAMTALVGPSGSGKTTLLHCLGLLLAPTSGRVLIDDVDTTGWTSRQRRRFWQDHAAFVLQEYGVIEDESVAFNVTMAKTIFGFGIAGDHRRMRSALSMTGLEGRERELAGHLSGGEKRRLSIARAIYKNAQIIFADEPTASLDDDNRANVIELFTSLARRGCVVVVATHDAEIIAACDVEYSLHRDHVISANSDRPMDRV